MLHAATASPASWCGPGLLGIGHCHYAKRNSDDYQSERDASKNPRTHIVLQRRKANQSKIIIP